MHVKYHGEIHVTNLYDQFYGIITRMDVNSKFAAMITRKKKEFPNLMKAKMMFNIKGSCWTIETSKVVAYGPVSDLIVFETIV